MDRIFLVIDMQKIFARENWHVTNIEAITGNIEKLCKAFNGRAIFTRHLSNPRAKGTWQAYNEEFSFLEKDPSNWELIDELKPFAETVIVKHTYSCFDVPRFQKILNENPSSGFVIAGVETEFCVLATLLDMVDSGRPVTLVTDAVGTEEEDLNETVIKICRRMPSQVKLKTTDEIIALVQQS